ncbi:hypothetical protein FOZ60_014108 [Perkinsus olseni]|uniref:Uncharacterized protein n=1 Tax=Perkinsus olseni TaxID=32597 RepID=A0A7J6P7M6_PEROL|nr:hypothetical protein FOZ60_014108 [Perkinsus olseni]
MLALEVQIHTETDNQYSQALTPIGETLRETLRDNALFLADCHAVHNGPEICDLWQNSYAWLTEELVYLDSAGEEDLCWLTPVIRWAILVAAADLDGGKVLVGRLDLRKGISTAVSNVRSVSAHPITSSHSSYRGSTSAVPTGTTTPPTNVVATASNGTNHNNITGVVSSRDVVRRTVKSIVANFTKRLRCDIDPIGNATVCLYRRHQKVCAMGAHCKVRRVQDSDLPIVCGPILIDKFDRADGKSQLKTVPVSDTELSSRYRLVIDTRPLNSLQLTFDDSGNFILVPGDEIPKDSKQRDEFSYKQHQRTTTNLLKNVPSANLG